LEIVSGLYARRTYESSRERGFFSVLRVARQRDRIG
jgi:hypothetical protein